MKRIRTAILLLIIGILPFSLALGQENKNEKKVKVIVADKSGTTVVIDTTFAGTDKIDSVVIKDGNVIYIGKNDPEISVKTGGHYKIIAHVETDGENTGRRYIYVNDDDKVVSKSGDDVFDIMVTDDDFDNNTDRTKYVISKDGITISIEGDDEAKVKEIISEIEKKLDVNVDEKKPAVKESEVNTVKKK
jgi:hypothetical protein